jgi:hypothetical protein
MIAYAMTHLKATTFSPGEIHSFPDEAVSQSPGVSLVSPSLQLTYSIRPFWCCVVAVRISGEVDG